MIQIHGGPFRALRYVVLTTWAVAGCASFALLLLLTGFLSTLRPLGPLAALSILTLAELGLIALRSLIRVDARRGSGDRVDRLATAADRAATAAAVFMLLWLFLAADTWWTALLLIGWFLAIESAWQVSSRSLPRQRNGRLARRNGTVAGESMHGGERADEWYDARVEQSIRRMRHHDGTVRLEGMIRVDLAASERLAACHVAFCPPLAERPEFTAETRDSPPVDVRVTDVECYGARIELRRSIAQSGESESFVVVWTASSASAPRSLRESRSTPVVPNEANS